MRNARKRERNKGGSHYAGSVGEGLRKPIGKAYTTEEKERMLVEARKGRSRVAVVGAPSSINGPTLTIRKFNRWYTSDELIDSGSMPAHVRDTVVDLIGKKKNGIISGGTGSGKTTLMKAFLDHIPEHERLLIIEQPAELKVAHRNAVRWEAVEEIPGQVAITPSELLAAALRHRPDRIIMGEIRNECGYDLLQAMNTGHGGTLSTIHAKSAWDALTLPSMAKIVTSSSGYMQYALTVCARLQSAVAYSRRSIIKDCSPVMRSPSLLRLRW